MARHFAKDSREYVVSSLGAISSGIDAFTLVAVAVFDSFTGTQYVLSLAAAGANIRYSLRVSSSGELTLSIDGIAYPGSSPIMLAAGHWYLLSVGKVAGSSVAVYRAIDYESGILTQSTSSSVAGTSANSASKIVIGDANPPDAAPLAVGGSIAVAAVYSRLLGVDETTALAGGTIATWSSSDPSAMWVLDQSSVSQALLDWTGGGANQSGISGTTVSTASAPIGYGHSVWGGILSTASGEPSFVESGTCAAAASATGVGVSSRATSGTSPATAGATGSAAAARVSSGSAVVAAGAAGTSTCTRGGSGSCDGSGAGSGSGGSARATSGALGGSSSASGAPRHARVSAGAMGATGAVTGAAAVTRGATGVAGGRAVCTAVSSTARIGLGTAVAVAAATGIGGGAPSGPSTTVITGEGSPRWVVGEGPPRWVTGGSMIRIASSSTEWVPLAEVIALGAAGDVVDLTGATVGAAYMSSEAEPTAWLPAIIEARRRGHQVSALIGPGGTVLAEGSWAAWIRVQFGSEDVRRRAATLVVT